MRAWFESLEHRERLFVAGGAVVVAFAVLWGLVWMPLDKGHRDLQERVSTWERSLAELRPLVSMPQPASGSQAAPQISSTQSPVVIVDTTLRERQLGQPKRSQPTPNGIRVEFENVAFDDLMLWLGDLSTQYGMEVQAGSLSTAARSGPGRINATLTIERTL
ncbi:MAG: type II secretion system protein M [Woeseiaceae bacterium]|nr:type II secretion system protein M [Woeseiaceae bacterium]